MKTTKQSRFQLYMAILSVLLLFLFPIAEWVRINFDSSVYKFLTGYLLGSIAAMAFELLTHWWHMRKKGGLFTNMDSPFERAFLFFLFSFILLLGTIIWIVSWIGTTGIFFGLGAFLAQRLVNIGLGQILKEEAHHSPSQTAS